jgi:hypothetical protein
MFSKAAERNSAVDFIREVTSRSPIHQADYAHERRKHLLTFVILLPARVSMGTKYFAF